MMRNVTDTERWSCSKAGSHHKLFLGYLKLKQQKSFHVPNTVFVGLESQNSSATTWNGVDPSSTS